MSSLRAGPISYLSLYLQRHQELQLNNHQFSSVQLLSRVRLFGPAGFASSDKTRPDSPVPTLQGHYDQSQNWRGRLRFLTPLEMRPYSIARNPVESREAPPTRQRPSPLIGTLGSSLRSPTKVGGNEGFPLQPEKDIESPSSTRLEALVTSHDSRVMTSSPSPCAWRHEFPGTARDVFGVRGLSVPHQVSRSVGLCSAVLSPRFSEHRTAAATAVGRRRRGWPAHELCIGFPN